MAKTPNCLHPSGLDMWHRWSSGKSITSTCDARIPTRRGNLGLDASWFRGQALPGGSSSSSLLVQSDACDLICARLHNSQSLIGCSIVAGMSFRHEACSGVLNLSERWGTTLGLTLSFSRHAAIAFASPQ